MFERLQINPNQSFVYDELLSAFESGYFNREKKETAEGELKRWLEWVGSELKVDIVIDKISREIHSRCRVYQTFPIHADGDIKKHVEMHDKYRSEMQNITGIPKELL